MKVLVDLYLLKKIEAHLLYLSELKDKLNEIGATTPRKTDNNMLEDLEEIKLILNQSDHGWK